MIPLVIGCVIGLAGFTYGYLCWREARKWAVGCRDTKIAIAYKNKVKMSPSLEEMLVWGRKAAKGGTVFYGQGGTRIAIIHTAVRPGLRLTRKRGRNHTPPSPVREGTWSAKDETVKA